MEKDDSLTKYYISLILLGAIIVLMLFSNNSQERVEKGDIVTVEYTGSYLNGTVFATSDPEVAISTGIYQLGRSYEPMTLQAGRGNVIEGIDKAVIGMKIGGKKHLVIPPEEAYPVDPSLIMTLPLVDDYNTVIPRTVEIPVYQFEDVFNTSNENKTYKAGDKVYLPDPHIQMTIIEMGDYLVNLSYDLKVGDRIKSDQISWDEIVVAANATAITIMPDVEVGEVIQLPGSPWNSTVIDRSATSVRLEHNPVPDTTIQTLFGPISVHFNSTDIVLDSNNMLAGRTLVFDIKVVDIQNLDEALGTEP